MARFHVWTKLQAGMILLTLVLVIAAVSCGVTVLLLSSPENVTEENGSRAVFAEAGMFALHEAATPAADAAATAAIETVIPVTAAPTVSSAETPSSAEETPTAPPDRSLHVEVIRATVPPPTEEKRILIYHTHTWEAYQQSEEAPYVETEKWRTKDTTANVVAVGTALTASLRALGYTVVHDQTAFEPPDLSTAYQRSLTMLEKRTRLGETYDLYIDLHRDAFSSAAQVTQTVSVGGADVARFMVLVGKGTGSAGQGYDVKPDWERNLALAEKITDSLNAQVENLCRDVKVKTGRFNQHIAPHCVLIECGNNRNALSEVLRGVPYLAEAIRVSLSEE